MLVVVRGCLLYSRAHQRVGCFRRRKKPDDAPRGAAASTCSGDRVCAETRVALDPSKKAKYSLRNDQKLSERDTEYSPGLELGAAVTEYALGRTVLGRKEPRTSEYPGERREMGGGHKVVSGAALVRDERRERPKKPDE